MQAVPVSQDLVLLPGWCAVTPAEAIEQAGQIEAETAYRNQLAHEMYEAGRGDGYAAGRRDADAAETARWAAVANPVARGGATYAELENRRWGPGGRAHFGDPRPGDFPGRTEPEQPEPEASL